MLFRIVKKIIISTFALYTILSFFIIANANEYEWSVTNKKNEIVTNANLNKENETINLECESAILIEQNSGQVLYEKNAHDQLRPASVTKLMSILLIFEALESRTNNNRRQSSMQ